MPLFLKCLYPFCLFQIVSCYEEVGQGVGVTRPFSTGEFLCEYKGEAIRGSTAKGLEKEREKTGIIIINNK